MGCNATCIGIATLVRFKQVAIRFLKKQNQFHADRLAYTRLRIEQRFGRQTRPRLQTNRLGLSSYSKTGVQDLFSGGTAILQYRIGVVKVNEMDFFFFASG